MPFCCMRYGQLRDWESRNPPAELLRIGYRSITQGLAGLTFVLRTEFVFAAVYQTGT